MITLSESWKTTYPDASVGILVMKNVTNPGSSYGLSAVKQELEESLRERYEGFERKDLKSLPVFEAYTSYYKQFKKTYHLLLQLESIILKGKSIPSVAALVECMFMAEMKNLLLTSGHDFDKVQGKISIHAAEGSESYVRYNNQDQVLKPGDMYICDEESILSSIIYGPDSRTAIAGETSRVLFTVYGVPGISIQAAEENLEDIRRYVEIVSPETEVEEQKVYAAV